MGDSWWAHTCSAAGCGNVAARCRLPGDPHGNRAAGVHAHTKKCPRYVADPKGYRLTATVVEAKDLLP